MKNYKALRKINANLRKEYESLVPKDVLAHTYKGKKPKRVRGQREITSHTYQVAAGLPYLVTEKSVVRPDHLVNPAKAKPAELLDLLNSLPLVVKNSGSAFLGMFPARIGARPPRFHFPSFALKLFFATSPTIFNYIPDFNPFEYVLTMGGFATNKGTIQNQMDCASKHKPFDMKRAKKWKPVLEKYIHKLRIVELTSPRKEDLENIKIVPETYPGFRWREVFGFKSKKDCSTELLIATQYLWDKIKRGDIIAASVWAMGDKEKRDDLVEQFFSSRPVHMPEAHADYVIANHAVLVEQWLRRFPSHPIYLGWSPTHLGYKRLQKDMDFSNAIIEGDWKKYDSTLSEELLAMGMAIFSTFFAPTAMNRNLFLYSASQLIFKNYVIPGGFIFRINSGMPSGSRLTALLNSLVNFLLLTHIAEYYFKVEKTTDVRFAIGGDDFLIFLNKIPILLDINVISDGMMEEFGVELKKKGSRFYDCDFSKVANCPTFYKYCIFEGLPTIKPETMAERILCPNTRLKGSFTLDNYYKSLFGNPFARFEWVDLLFTVMSGDDVKYSASLKELWDARFIEIYLTAKSEHVFDESPKLRDFTGFRDEDKIQNVLLVFDDYISPGLSITKFPPGGTRYIGKEAIKNQRLLFTV